MVESELRVSSLIKPLLSIDRIESFCTTAVAGESKVGKQAMGHVFTRCATPAKKNTASNKTWTCAAGLVCILLASVSRLLGEDTIEQVLDSAMR